MVCMTSGSKLKRMVHLCDKKLMLGRRTLARLQWQREKIMCERDRVQSEIDMFGQLNGVDSLNDSTVNRAELFRWLRRKACSTHKTQALRLEREKLDTQTEETSLRIREKRMMCVVLEGKLKHRSEEWRKECRRIRNVCMNDEEAELEEVYFGSGKW